MSGFRLQYSICLRLILSHIYSWLQWILQSFKQAVCKCRLTIAEYHEQEEIFKLRLGHLKKVNSSCVLQLFNRKFQVLWLILIYNVSVFIWIKFKGVWAISPCAKFSVSWWMIDGVCECSLGGGRDPSWVGALGESAESSHPRAEENKQRGQLSVSTVTMVSLYCFLQYCHYLCFSVPTFFD